MKNITIIIIHCLITTLVIGQNQIVDINKLKKTDPTWEIVKTYSEKTSGRITYKSQKWLMYFIHWRELNDDNKNISVEYATHLLKTLWGMSFKFTDNSGECAVNGHQAYFAEATISDMIKTRFIVWNCNESNRQFIADCNINLAAKTPENLFELQCERITPNF